MATSSTVAMVAAFPPVTNVMETTTVSTTPMKFTVIIILQNGGSIYNYYFSKDVNAVYNHD